MVCDSLSKSGSITSFSHRDHGATLIRVSWIRSRLGLIQTPMLGRTHTRPSTRCLQQAGKVLHRSVRFSVFLTIIILTSMIVPIYLDHVVVPTLTDEGCYTEVHHIDGNGIDAGYEIKPTTHSSG